MSDQLTTRPKGAARARWRRPAPNMTGVERVVRLLAGFMLAIGGSWMVASYADGAVAVLAWVLLALGVADLVLSGLLAYCPVYHFVRAPGTPSSES
jgi:hypothetical protein